MEQSRCKIEPTDDAFRYDERFSGFARGNAFEEGNEDFATTFDGVAMNAASVDEKLINAS